MSQYQPTPKQEQAIREYLNEAVTPLIEQVLVKKLGQAMKFAADELIQPKREWVGLTNEEIAEAGKLFLEGNRMLPFSLARAIEAKLKEKNCV